MKSYYVYILASKKDGVLYIGITNNLIRRVYYHKGRYKESFTQKYFIRRLVYFEQLNDPLSAIKREKQLKKWKRDWKIELIEKENPEWKDLYEEIKKY
ncbi:MAG: GIY-YIG nuclease family protein [Candidatus Berkelbacteria bacterium]|nr:GIY-YIG nuclease family protein [Candidatus Berkelbacteria bacterium]